MLILIRNSFLFFLFLLSSVALAGAGASKPSSSAGAPKSSSSARASKPKPKSSSSVEASKPKPSSSPYFHPYQRSEGTSQNPGSQQYPLFSMNSANSMPFLPPLALPAVSERLPAPVGLSSFSLHYSETAPILPPPSPTMILPPLSSTMMTASILPPPSPTMMPMPPLFGASSQPYFSHEMVGVHDPSFEEEVPLQRHQENVEPAVSLSSVDGVDFLHGAASSDSSLFQEESLAQQCQEELVDINHLDIHNFRNVSDRKIKELIEFLKSIPPELTKISFINSSLPTKNIEALEHAIENENLFNNIVKLEFINTKIKSYEIPRLLRIVLHLKKLTHLNFDLSSKDLESSDSSSSQKTLTDKQSTLLKNAMGAFVYKISSELKTLSFSGNHFSVSTETMDHFIDNILLVKVVFVFLEELDISKTNISRDRISSLLNVFIEHPGFLPCLKKLYIPSIIFNGENGGSVLIKCNEWIKVLQSKRPHLEVILR